MFIIPNRYHQEQQKQELSTNEEWPHFVGVLVR
jgi:hypothetical protein